MVERRRFFSDNSYWNQSIPNDVEIDPKSDHFINLLANDPDGPQFGINLHQWTMPVLDADNNTPTVSIGNFIHSEESLKARGSKWQGVGDRFGHGPGFGVNVPIPENAKPDPEGDAHMAIVNWDTGQAWDTWGCSEREDGTWVSNTGMTYNIYNDDGVFKTEDFPDVKNGDSIHFHGPSRAAGVPAIAGLIMHHEIEAGKIEHKLAFASRNNAYKQFTFPAAWTDGYNDGGIPEGATIQLDPSLDLNQFDLSRGGRIVAEALQTYGAINVDNAGGNALYGEGLWCDESRSWEGVLDPFDIKDIHLKHFRVIKMGEVIALGDDRRRGAGH